MTPISALSGRLMALKYYDEHRNRDIRSVPSRAILIKDNFAVCRSILYYHTQDPFLKKIEDLWRKTFIRTEERDRLWAQDIIWAYRIGLSEIYVHQQLAKGRLTAADLNMDEKVFCRYVNMEERMMTYQYRALSGALEMYYKRDIIYMYTRLAELFGIEDIPYKKLHEYTFQDMMDHIIP